MRPAPNVMVFLCLLGAGPAHAEDELPRYVGQARCQSCHTPHGAARACALPANPKHAGARNVLLDARADEIAVYSGDSSPPTTSTLCAACHRTGHELGPRWWTDTFNHRAGVECEACHSPGSLHAADPAARPLPRDRNVCVNCHRPLPSHDWVLRDGVAREPADRFYRTPVDIAFAPDGSRLYVPCNHSNLLAVIDSATRAVIALVPVGPRPTGVAVSPDHRHIFVTERLADTVSIIDAGTLRITATIPVGDEPHGVAIDPTNRWLLVANTGDNTISVIDVAASRELRRLTAGSGPWSIGFFLDGSAAVTHVRPQPAPFQQPHASELALIEPDGSAVRDRPRVPDANMLKGLVIIPAGPHRGAALFTLARTKNLVPATRLAQGWVMTHGLGVLRPDGTLDQVLLDEPTDAFADLNGIAVSPDGCWAAVTSGGTDRVAIIQIDQLIATIDSQSPDDRRNVLPNHLGMSDRFVTRRIATGANPRGLAFSPDGRVLCVANALDDSLTWIDTATWTSIATTPLGGPAEITTLRRGERLFHSADIAFGRQFSCQSCHPDGHINGLTMDIEADGVGLKPVDNRTLRGIIDTGPFKWEGTNPSLARQCGARLAVFFTRREPYTPEELQALVRYECTIERPPNRYRSPEGLTPAQYRGKLVFERTSTNAGAVIPTAQRCTACHNGPYKTAQNRTIVRTATWFDSWVNLPLAGESMFDSAAYGDLGIFYFADAGVPPELLDAPHLTNIYDSAPYLHSGAAATLEEIWTRYNYVGGHGVTNDLTRRQYNDLIAYLRAL